MLRFNKDLGLMADEVANAVDDVHDALKDPGEAAATVA